MGRLMKKQGPKNLARVADEIESARVQRYLVQRGSFKGYVRTSSALVVEGFRARGYTVELVEGG